MLLDTANEHNELDIETRGDADDLGERVSRVVDGWDKLEG
jgi:hypothetical protein